MMADIEHQLEDKNDSDNQLENNEKSPFTSLNNSQYDMNSQRTSVFDEVQSALLYTIRLNEKYIEKQRMMLKSFGEADGAEVSYIERKILFFNDRIAFLQDNLTRLNHIKEKYEELNNLVEESKALMDASDADYSNPKLNENLNDIRGLIKSIDQINTCLDTILVYESYNVESILGYWLEISENVLGNCDSLFVAYNQIIDKAIATSRREMRQDEVNSAKVRQLELMAERKVVYEEGVKASEELIEFTANLNDERNKNSGTNSEDIDSEKESDRKRKEDEIKRRLLDLNARNAKCSQKIKSINDDLIRYTFLSYGIPINDKNNDKNDLSDIYKNKRFFENKKDELLNKISELKDSDKHKEMAELTEEAYILSNIIQEFENIIYDCDEQNDFYNLHIKKSEAFKKYGVDANELDEQIRECENRIMDISAKIIALEDTQDSTSDGSRELEINRLRSESEASEKELAEMQQARLILNGYAGNIEYYGENNCVYHYNSQLLERDLYLKNTLLDLKKDLAYNCERLEESDDKIKNGGLSLARLINEKENYADFSKAISLISNQIEAREKEHIYVNEEKNIRFRVYKDLKKQMEAAHLLNSRILDIHQEQNILKTDTQDEDAIKRLSRKLDEEEEECINKINNIYKQINEVEHIVDQRNSEVGMESDEEQQSFDILSNDDSEDIGNFGTLDDKELMDQRNKINKMQEELEKQNKQLKEKSNDRQLSPIFPDRQLSPINPETVGLPNFRGFGLHDNDSQTDFNGYDGDSLMQTTSGRLNQFIDQNKREYIALQSRVNQIDDDMQKDLETYRSGLESFQSNIQQKIGKLESNILKLNQKENVGNVSPESDNIIEKYTQLETRLSKLELEIAENYGKANNSIDFMEWLNDYKNREAFINYMIDFGFYSRNSFMFTCVIVAITFTVTASVVIGILLTTRFRKDIVNDVHISNKNNTRSVKSK